VSAHEASGGGTDVAPPLVGVVSWLRGLLPSGWGAHINAYLPEQAGTLIAHTHEQSGDLLSPWQGSASCASGRY
jgi:hypothetical protein